VTQKNRTCYDAKFIPSATITQDLRFGFPCLTTKQVYYKQAIGEILGFIRGYDSALEFRNLGCKIWDSDANENKTWLNSPYRKGEDDLGKIYGNTWRKRVVYKEDRGLNEEYLLENGYTHKLGNVYSKTIDQLHDVVDKIVNTPQDRRIILHAWFPELFDEMALPPCHVMYMFVPDEHNKVLHMTMTQRSTDFLLGAPFNLFGSGLLLQLIATATGYQPGQVTHNMTNVHLYENQIEAAEIQLTKNHDPLATLVVKQQNGTITTKSAMMFLEKLEPSDIELVGYKHQGPLPKVKMAQEK